MPVSTNYRPAPRITELGDGFYDAVEAARFPERRLRFQPALDVRGKKIPATITWVHEFVREERLDYDAED